MSALEQLHNMVGENERILWSGRPNFKCFIWKSVFNPVLPFALVCGTVALYQPISLIGAGQEQGILNGPLSFSGALLLTFPIVLFLSIPVWIYLGKIFFDFLNYRNIAFLVSDKGFYSSRGIFSLDFNHKPFMEMAHVNLYRSFMDRMLGVGNVIFTLPLSQIRQALQQDKNYSKSRSKLSIYDIPDYQQVYNLVKELQQNIYSDVQYPNDLRTKENHGYNASYIPPENKQ